MPGVIQDSAVGIIDIGLGHAVGIRRFRHRAGGRPDGSTGVLPTTALPDRHRRRGNHRGETGLSRRWRSTRGKEDLAVQHLPRRLLAQHRDRVAHSTEGCRIDQRHRQVLLVAAAVTSIGATGKWELMLSIGYDPREA